MKTKLYIYSQRNVLFFFIFCISSQIFGGEIEQLNSYETWNRNPRIIPSTDPAGIVWSQQTGHIFIVDSEINEEESWNFENIFEVNYTGSFLYETYVSRPESDTSSSREPCGICYYPAEGYYYIVNDDRHKLYQYEINFGTITLVQEWYVNVSPFFIDDPEGISVNPANGHLYIADGGSGDNKIVAIRVDGSSLIHIPSESFSVAHEQEDAEGVAFRPSSGTLFIVSEEQGGKIFEWDISNGTLLDTYDLSGFSPAPIAPQGLTFGPRSSNNSFEAIYIADGGFDNTDYPGFPLIYNDGVIYEAKIGVDDVSLPVELTSFTAGISGKNIQLEWITASELENVGFEVMRTDDLNEEYTIIASYRENMELLGHGNTSNEHNYNYTDYMVEAGKTYWYKLVDWDVSGIKTYHGPVSVTIEDGLFSPIAFKLHPNYPNPFNPTTNIKFDIPILTSGSINTKLEIFNSIGQLTKSLYHENLSEGTYEVTWDGTNNTGNQSSAGVYYAHLSVGSYSQSIKMILIK